VLDDVFVAGDVARWPHLLYENQLLAVEHPNNAVEQARTAAHNTICESRDRRAHTVLPTFWSHQFGVNIKSVGGSIIRRGGDGYAGRSVSTLPCDCRAYEVLIEASAPFPPNLHAAR
jgi:3-phenylpropionate/trans-cinnamate dioxygenase ferredoxin reductase component